MESFLSRSDTAGSSVKSKSYGDFKKAEPVTLANLDKDCFIIPIANLDRFLPAGVPVSIISSNNIWLNIHGKIYFKGYLSYENRYEYKFLDV